MRVLVIDNNIDPFSWGAANLRRMAQLAPGVTVETRRGPDGDLPTNPARFDRVIISGSKTSALESAPWIDALHEFIRRTIDLGNPLLGVCYGHQSLVRALGGIETVRKGMTPEFGWTLIERLEEPSSLFEGLPKKFHTFSAHFEEVSALPAGMRRLARSEACEIQACQLGMKPVFGIQFHPEKDVADANEIFVHRKKLGIPKNLLHPNESEKLYDQQTSEKLFLNFLTL